jgi:hypothetical protein
MSSPATGDPSSTRFTRRTLLAATLAGTALAAVGCTDGDDGEPVTPAQVDQLAAQVAVQSTLVAAYERAFAANSELATAAATLADQARTQLDRLRAAAPGAAADVPPPEGTAAAASAAGGSAPRTPAAKSARSWLRSQVGAAAEAHATACPGFSGARAALLGSIAAGLRGQQAQLV